ncbi:MAG TPA: endonuclease/exonuclease/phosphatase family protein [Myxococcaceae bacterium]|nr:endonuclease/exonuclease/phosphatase family protein [Myxococcaceae bacterium]
MRHGIAVGLWMVAFGACQVAALPQAHEALAGSQEAELFGPGTLTVMTRSLELGAGLERALEEAPSAAELPARTAEALATLRQTDFIARARGLADEIQYARPHLIGLQEVSEVRVQSPGDALFGGTQPAEEVAVDFLPLLLGELAARGLHYREVARVRNTDVEVPLLASATPTFDDVRLTDYDVLLARADVEVSGSAAGNYQARREVRRSGAEPVVLLRGWTSVVARVGGRTYRFVNTHLEPAPDEARLRVQLAQAEELISRLRGEPLPVVLMGNFNTPANLGRVGAPTYRELLLAGYVDVWTRRREPREWGPTCCEAAEGAPRVPVLAQRQNLVLVRNSVMPLPRRIGPVLAWRVGGLLEEHQPEPWPTALTGVAVRQRIPGAILPPH